MNIYEVLFLLQFLVVLGITGIKVINIVNIAGFITENNTRIKQEKRNSIKEYGFIFLTFAGFMVAWFVGLVVMLLQTETLLYSTLMIAENILLIFNIVLVIGELVFLFSAKATSSVEAFNSSGR